MIFNEGNKRLLFVGKAEAAARLPKLQTLTRRLQELGAQVCATNDSAEAAKIFARAGAEVVDAASAAPALVVSLGGDGAFLGAARRFAPAGAALVGVNLGYLGFLTDLSVDNVGEELPAIVEGKCQMEERGMLATAVGGKALTGENAAAVNDVVISRGRGGALLRLRVFVGGAFAYELRADGLIVSTPSGSTAYALAAGGPIVAPNVDSTLLAPLCPHALTHRPFVVRGGLPTRVEVALAEAATLHIDGGGGMPIASGDVAEITRHAAPLKICHPRAYNYYQTLRAKLLWGE